MFLFFLITFNIPRLGFTSQRFMYINIYIFKHLININIWYKCQIKFSRSEIILVLPEGNTISYKPFNCGVVMLKSSTTTRRHHASFERIYCLFLIKLVINQKCWSVYSQSGMREMRRFFFFIHFSETSNVNTTHTSMATHTDPWCHHRK